MSDTISESARVLKALRRLLKSESIETHSVSSAKDILGAIEEGDFDAVLMDMNYVRGTTSGQEGLELIPRIHALDGALPVVVMTAWATADRSTRIAHHSTQNAA